MGVYAKILKSEARRLVRDEGGVALMLTLGVFLFLFLACCGVYAVGETISRRVDLQNACDAGAHAAAVAQADVLSRMAVVNRAMSWNYVQMTKMQLDYITYNWLKVTCNNFAADKKECLKHTGLGEMLSRKAGYCFLPEELQGLLTLPLSDTDFFGLMHFKPYTDRNSNGYDPFVDKWYNIPVEIDWGGITWLHWPMKWTVINCYHNIHNKENNRISNYIGMRSGNDTDAEEIKINGNDLSEVCLHFRDGGLREGMPSTDPATGQRLYGGDLDYVVKEEVEQEAILSQIEGVYGGYGCPDLSDMIDHMKMQIGTCNTFLIGLNSELTNDIRRAAMEAIRQSLPRTDETDGGIVTDGLEDYYCLVFGGVSSTPREYGIGDEAIAGDDGSRRYRSFFSGLRNIEQDEMLFLNMADGLPDPARVTLADYFFDGQYEEPKDIRVPGLDQWFVRCAPEESQYDGTGALPLAGSECGGPACVTRGWDSRGGIIRCYKNANYHDLRSQMLPSDVHRGNYCFDDISESVDEIINSATSVVGNGLASVLGGVIPVAGPWIAGKVGDIVSSGIASLLSPIRNLIKVDIVKPSCLNEVSSWPDMCKAVPESVGLLAEYEWSSAYWVCWHKKQGFWPGGSVVQCGHIPLAFGAVFGGATDNGYNPDRPFGWARDATRNFIGNPKGHSRDAYRSDCMFIDGEKWRVPGCHSEEVERVTKNNGHGANVVFKAYGRVYGDDRDAYDKNYYGTPAMPWLLNEEFFNGAGTIVVGLARKNRNAFEALLGAIEEKTNIFSLFTPLEGSHLVAFAAGRAAYAPRTGSGDADGPDTFNNGRGAMRYDIHYDATAKNLEPRLPPGGPFDREWRDLDGELKKLKDILENASYGCVCTEDGNTADPSKMVKTRERLRRQWNLCQTDWDGVLLPLRYARAPIAEWFANKSGDHEAPAGADHAPAWAPGTNGESAMELSQILMNVNASDPEDPMLWHRLDGEGTTSLKELLHQGGNQDRIEWAFDETGFAQMIWARRIL